MLVPVLVAVVAFLAGLGVLFLLGVRLFRTVKDLGRRVGTASARISEVAEGAGLAKATAYTSGTDRPDRRTTHGHP